MIVDSVPPELRQDLLSGESLLQHLPEHAPADSKVSLRVAHEGAVSALHYDSGRTVLLQLEGLRDVLIYPPAELPNLYPFPKSHYMFRRTLADPEYPDPELLPKFEAARGYRARLGPGDLLYMPANWAHYIRAAEGTSVSIGKRSSVAGEGA